MKLPLTLTTTIGAIALLAGPGLAAPCRDAKGKFIKCAPAASAAMPGGITKDAKGKCHAAGGKFVACPK